MYSSATGSFNKLALNVAMVTATSLLLSATGATDRGLAATADPILLSCELSGRTILGIVVFKRLKKLRIWYGDGGGQDWDNVDFTKDPIKTTVKSDNSLVLSRDYRHVTFNGEGNEHSAGTCHPGRMSKAPRYWFDPVLKQG
jgi:hypothetical protein